MKSTTVEQTMNKTWCPFQKIFKKSESLNNTKKNIYIYSFFSFQNNYLNNPRIKKCQKLSQNPHISRIFFSSLKIQIVWKILIFSNKKFLCFSKLGICDLARAFQSRQILWRKKYGKIFQKISERKQSFWKNDYT